jgi:hypothetical protein
LIKYVVFLKSTEIATGVLWLIFTKLNKTNLVMTGGGNYNILIELDPGSIPPEYRRVLDDKRGHLAFPSLVKRG